MPKSKTLVLSCTFCGKTQEDVSKLIAGPGVCICNECVNLCNEIMVEEEVPGAVNRYELEDSDTADTEMLLQMVRRTRSQAAPLDAYLGKLIDRLRDQGVTWAKIGEALGVSRQAAWMRFSNEE